MADEVKDRRLRFLWNSNGTFIPSGYGVFQRDFLYRLLKDGWPVAQIAFSGLEGFPVTIDGLLHYPRMGDVWGADGMIMHGRHFQANAIFSMMDVHVLDPNALAQLKVWIPYLPIDKEPVPQIILDRLKYAYKIITFSKFGQKALMREGFASECITEGVDTNIFKPMDKMKARKEVGLPENAIIIGQIGANKPDPLPRKGWQQSLEAFKLFHDNHAEAIYFYEVNQPGGFPIEEYGKHLGIERQLFKLDPYISIFHADSKVMNKLLNAFDMTLHPSSTEGFGLVVVESQSAGTPVIVNNCTSMPELIVEGKTGEICEVGNKVWSPGGGFFQFADVTSLHEKMEKLYDSVKSRESTISSACRNHVLENFDIDKIVKEKWIPLLENLQKELLPSVDKIQNTL